MSQEQRARMKSTIFWLWVFKSFQRCWAGRWANTNEYPHLPRLLGGIGCNKLRPGERSSYTRLGRFSLLDGSGSSSSRSTSSNNVASDIAWKLWGKHSSNASQTTSQSSQPMNTASRFIPPIFAASLARSSAASTQNEAQQLSEIHYHGDFDHEYDEYDEYYYDEDDDNIFYLQEDVVAVRKNPTKHEQLTTTAPVESSTTTKTVIPASVKLRKRKSKPAPPTVIEEPSDEQRQLDILALTQPIVPISISLEGETGEVFQDPAAMDRLVESGLDMVRLETNEWIDWKIDKHSKKLLQDKTEKEVLEEGDVIVYVGTAKQEGHGSHLPIIKTKSILPLSARDMAELLMDSTRVKIYNHMSLGRTDVRTLGKNDENNGNGNASNTKIVCNLTKPPIAKSKMVSCTLMHSRKLSGSSTNDGKKKKKHHTETEPAVAPRDTYLVVSRACPGMIEDSMKDLPRNDILLGVNLLEDIGDNQCIMTAVTHVYSPALPTMLAKSMGVGSAVNFVKEIRKSCETTRATTTTTATTTETAAATPKAKATAKPVEVVVTATDEEVAAVVVTATEEQVAAAAASALTGIEVK